MNQKIVILVSALGDSADYSILVPQDAIQISGKETFVWMDTYPVVA